MQNQQQDEFDVMRQGQSQIVNSADPIDGASTDGATMAPGIEINFARIDAAEDIHEILDELQADAAATDS